ncbi:MAG: Gfo/Idh/MocA family oxidoreductase [Terracidiphilus sp.]|jgi:predicted dehydrogenase
MIRACLIGFGMAGRVFHAPLISSVEGIELAAVVERNFSNAAARYPGITTHRSLEAALADSSIDLFVVATPSGTHFEVARQILDAARPVVVDKPMSTTAAEISQLIRLAEARKTPLIPFFNRRWDSDFQTIHQLLDEHSLGRVVYFESRFDRWRPDPPSNRLWKEDPAQGGGVLLDLGTHLADQALTLFGKPESVSADVLCERPWARANDAFTLRLRYPNFTAVLGSNSLSTPPGPRFHLRGDRGNYIKTGLDPQEAVLNQITRIADPQWGRESPASWGILYIEEGGAIISRPIKPIPGDYRLFYAGVRDVLLGKAQAPTKAVEAWRTARLLEWAVESSDQHREIPCDWNEEPV